MRERGMSWFSTKGGKQNIEEMSPWFPSSRAEEAFHIHKANKEGTRKTSQEEK
jgi:hypothetical protein